MSSPATAATPAAGLLGLVSECDSSASLLLASHLPALASASLELIARNDSFVKRALRFVTALRPALLSHKARVLGRAKRCVLKRSKVLVVAFEALDVSVEQLRLCSAGLSLAGHDSHEAALDGACAVVQLAVLSLLVHVAVRAVGVRTEVVGALAGPLGSVTSSDGLRIASAVGPGLKWFKPSSRNEFSVVLCERDGSVPVWLTSGDVTVSATLVPSAVGGAVPQSTCEQTEQGAAADDLRDQVPVVAQHPPASTFVARMKVGLHGDVTVVYEGVGDDVDEMDLQLTVCGVEPVPELLGGAGDAAPATTTAWSVRRKPLLGHNCVAQGTFVRELKVTSESRIAMAVSVDEEYLVVGARDTGVINVYSLPEGAHVRSFGCKGTAPLQFNDLCRMCFSPAGTLIVADRSNLRLQEVTLEGVFVRFIGVGEFEASERTPYSVAVSEDSVAVGCFQGSGPRIVLFDLVSGTKKTQFGKVGTGPEELTEACTSVRFFPDGSRIIVACYAPALCSLTVFTTGGDFVRRFGNSTKVSRFGSMDLLFSACGDLVVVASASSRVCVFPEDGDEPVCSWESAGVGLPKFTYPFVLAAAGLHLFVIEYSSGRVYVFV